MKQQLLKQVAYEHWANTTLLKALRQTPQAPQRAFELLGHVIAVHDIWRARIQQVAPRYQLWDLQDLDAMESLIRDNVAFWTKYIEELDNDSFLYKITFNYFGTPAEVSVDDAITHIFNHSAYHRGQIVQLLKGHIDPLPVTTFLSYVLHPQI